MLWRSTSLSSTISRLRTLRSMKPAIERERLLERLAFDRLGQVRDRPEPQAALRLFEQRDDVHRDVARRRVVLEPIEHRPAVHDRQVDVEGDRVRLVVPRHRQADVAARRRQALEAFLVRHVQQDVRERQVVLDDQQDAIAVADRVAIVLDVALGDQRFVDPVHGALGGDPGGHFAALIHRPGRIELGRRVDARQVEREGAARADLAGQPDLAAEQPGDLPADRQPEAGAAVLPAGRAVGLLERLEDDAVLVGRNADAGVGDPEGDHRRGACSRCADRRPSPPSATSMFSLTEPVSVNFKAFESRFFSTCCSRFGSVSMSGGS